VCLCVCVCVCVYQGAENVSTHLMITIQSSGAQRRFDHIYIYICVCVFIYTQGVPGGRNKTSGKCFLCKNIQI
jgi:hypothetical protein